LDYLGEGKFLTTYSDITCGIEISTLNIEQGKPYAITIKVNDFIDYESYEFKYLGIPSDAKFPPERPR